MGLIVFFMNSASWIPPSAIAKFKTSILIPPLSEFASLSFESEEKGSLQQRTVRVQTATSGSSLLRFSMITQEKIAEIRGRASVVEVISDYVTLKKLGRNYVGLCPFHGEKTPSFTVNDEKGIFHCFSCKAGGSIFNFLMQHDHLSFPEAVEQVAKRYGIMRGAVS